MEAMPRRVTAALCICTLLMSPALAQTAGPGEALQAAKELQSVMSGDLVKQMVDQMMTAMWPNVESELGSKVSAAALSEIRGEFQRITLKFVQSVQDEAPAVYAKYFSAEELRAISAFYRYPAGVKALTVMPPVMGESMQMMANRRPDLQKEPDTSIEAVLRKSGNPPK